MAEFIRDKVLGNTSTRIVNENSPNLECAVCLQTCIHPAELPCGHIFCYLCIKGIVNQGRRCAMCRQDIPVDYLDKPKLLKPVDTEANNTGFEDGHLWFYEGHNGWWQYDERTSLELEAAYQKGERCCELLIAGFLYIADFDAMLQYRRNDPWKRRRIKRDLATTSKKGVAGLKPMKETNITSSSVPDLISNELIQSLPISPQSVRNTISGLRLLSLRDSSSNNSNTDNNDSAASESRLRNRTPLSFSNVHSQTQTQDTNSDTQLENTELFTHRNLDLDSIIHDTLDWTIEQIESLNLELMNDYEVLFRDVYSYNNLLDNVDRNRSGRGVRNYITTYHNSRQSQSPGNESVSRIVTYNLPRSNSMERNNVSNETPELRSPSLSSPDNSASGRTQITQTITDPPIPPPRTTGISRLRSRINFPKRSSSLGRETLL